MVKNYFYLITGILCVLFAFTHFSNGRTTILPLIEIDGIDVNTKTVFHYIWQIITVENLIFGITFLYMSFHRRLTKVKAIAWIIAIILAARWLVILLTTLYFNKDALPNILADTAAIVIVITLIFFGTRVAEKDELKSED
jgi:hypothetical protein